MIVTSFSRVHPAFPGDAGAVRELWALGRHRGRALAGTPDNAAMRVLRCVVALAVASLGLGCSPALDWREWRVAEAGVTLMFPCKPVRQQRQVEVGERSLRMVLLVCDAGGASWALAIADVQDPAAVTPLLRALAAAAHANLGAAPTPLLPAAVRGATPNAAAGRFRLQGRRGDGQALEEELLLFARGTWLVQATALGPTLPREGVANFIASVRAE